MRSQWSQGATLIPPSHGDVIQGSNNRRSLPMEKPAFSIQRSPYTRSLRSLSPRSSIRPCALHASSVESHCAGDVGPNRYMVGDAVFHNPGTISSGSSSALESAMVISKSAACCHSSSLIELSTGKSSTCELKTADEAEAQKSGTAAMTHKHQFMYKKRTTYASSDRPLEVKQEDSVTPCDSPSPLSKDVQLNCGWSAMLDLVLENRSTTLSASLPKTHLATSKPTDLILSLGSKKSPTHACAGSPKKGDAFQSQPNSHYLDCETDTTIPSPWSSPASTPRSYIASSKCVGRLFTWKDVAVHADEEFHSSMSMTDSEALATF